MNRQRTQISCVDDRTPPTIGEAIMESMKSTGTDTQFHGVKADVADRQQLVIGLDFGTAFTKVVVGEEGANMAIPLNGNGDTLDSYLLPSAYWSDDNGICSLEPSEYKKQHSGLKIPLLNNEINTDEHCAAAIFLALVLRRVRAYIFDNKSEIYGRKYIEWLVNIGLPTSTYQDDELSEKYISIVATAWFVSIQNEDISRQFVNRLWVNSVDVYRNQKTQPDALLREAIRPFPEFVAQLTGYVQSPNRQEDLHLLIDVGAGTLDVTIFNVLDKSRNDFPVFNTNTNVEKMGTEFLVEHRLRERKAYKNGKPFTITSFDKVPVKEAFADLLGIDVGVLEDEDRTFKGHITSLIREMLRYTKEKVYPLSRRWKGHGGGIIVFLCGGGSYCDFYADIFPIGKKKLYGYFITPMKLSRPSALEAAGVDDSEYNRMSVAYGLSFDPDNLGNIEEPEEFTHPPFQPESSMCPRCNGTGLHGGCNLCGGTGFNPDRNHS